MYVVAHKILVSAPVPFLVLGLLGLKLGWTGLGLGLEDWGLKGWGLALDKLADPSFASQVSVLHNPASRLQWPR